MVVRHSVDNIKLGTRRAANRSIPTVPNPSVDIPRIETFETLIERHPTLQHQGHVTVYLVIVTKSKYRQNAIVNYYHVEPISQSEKRCL